MMRAPTSLLPGMSMCNALTIDVEDYFHVSALAPYIARSEWDARECRVETNVERILAMLDEYGARATFFTLGWVAERYPGLVRSIVENGHELASHGFAHQRASDAESGGVLLGHPAREESCSRISRAWRSAATARRAFDRPRKRMGVRMHRASRLPVQLQRLPDPARSLRRARRAALHSRCA